MKKLIIFLLFTATVSASVFLNSFNSGQLGKDMKVRHDLDRTHMGSEELTNILIRPQGMAYKRPGAEVVDTQVNIPAVPAIPPAAFRDEAYMVSNSTQVVWFDSDWTVLSYENIPGNLCQTAAVDSTGITATGYDITGAGFPITRWDLDLVADVEFFVPDGGWASGQPISDVIFTDDDTILYAREYHDEIFAFDASNGDMLWRVDINARLGRGIAVDSSNNCYIPLAEVIRKIRPADGVSVKDYLPFTPALLVSGVPQCVAYDEVNGVAFTGGSWISSTLGGAAVSAGTEDELGNDNYWQGQDPEDVLTLGGYFYLAHDLGSVSGTTCSVSKLDGSLNNIAHYNTGFNAHAIWIDHDGNIAVASGDSDLGNDSGIWILDTDLNYIADNPYNAKEFHGNKGVTIPYLDSGTPEIPGIPGGSGVQGYTIRLLPFESSTNDAYPLEFGHKYIGFLRTTP